VTFVFFVASWFIFSRSFRSYFRLRNRGSRTQQAAGICVFAQLRVFIHGQLNRKGAAFAGLALDGDFALMRLDDVLDDGESQPAAFHVVHQARADTVKLLEDLGAFIRRNADAIIGDADRDMLVLLSQLNV